MKTQRVRRIPYLDQLKTIAPSIAFQRSRDRDEHCRWDGDGPDPARRGIYAYDVTVSARAINQGELVEGCDHLGGSYYRPDEPLGEVHGYLPQMLEEAVTRLLELKNLSLDLQRQCQAARAYLKDVMHRAWLAQRT